MDELPVYDAAIIGGGLAGLSAAIELRKKGHSVLLLEKESYPFNKVCGEYISLESWDFLEALGLPLKEMQLPHIDTLFLTAPNGKSFTTKLPLGGFGISRYMLDHQLAGIAKQNGVHLLEQTKADRVDFDGNFHIKTAPKEFKARACAGAFGKRSNLDIKWDREFLKARDKKLDNHIGVKYHIKTGWPPHIIGLHNFEDGYCGISKIEKDEYCLCYMTTAQQLNRSGNSIRQMEEQVLWKNPHLKKIFREAEFLPSFPVTISQISFSKKTRSEGHVLMLGDAAGMITPLCGNGMSIALHTGKIAARLMSDYIRNEISMDEMIKRYHLEWQQHFASRLRTGRALQRFFGSSALSNLFVQSFRTFPFLASPVVKMTHGKPY